MQVQRTRKMTMFAAAILFSLFASAKGNNDSETSQFVNSTSNETYPQLIRFLQDSPSYDYLSKNPNKVLVRDLTLEELSKGGYEISGMEADEMAAALGKGVHVPRFCPRGINPKPTLCQSCRKSHDDCDEDNVCCPFPVIRVAVSYRKRCPPRLTKGCLMSKRRPLPSVVTGLFQKMNICICLRRKYCCVEQQIVSATIDPNDWRDIITEDEEYSLELEGKPNATTTED